SPFKRDPISELIQHDPRRKEAIVQVRPRVPSLDDPDDDDDDAPPEPDPDPAPAPARPAAREGAPPRSGTRDEVAAMDALLGLDDPVRRVSSAAEQASLAAAKLEQAAQRAEAAAARVEVNGEP